MFASLRQELQSSSKRNFQPQAPSDDLQSSRWTQLLLPRRFTVQPVDSPPLRVALPLQAMQDDRRYLSREDASWAYLALANKLDPSQNISRSTKSSSKSAGASRARQNAMRSSSDAVLSSAHDRCFSTNALTFAAKAVFELRKAAMLI
jgi:hypothetical protein